MSINPTNENDSSYEAWLGDCDEIDDVWHTSSGETFAVTEKKIHLPHGIGPIEGEHQVAPKDLTSYDIVVEHRSMSKRIVIPFIISGILVGGGMLAAEGVDMVLYIGGILSFLAGAVHTVKERNRVSAQTHVTIHMGESSTTLTFNGDLEQDIEESLSPILSR